VKKKKEKKSKGGGGKSVDFGKYLRGLNRHLEKAKETAESTGFEEFDDGRYRMRAVDAKIGVSKNKRVQVVISWKFMDGDYKGKEKLDFEGLTEDHLPYLLKKLDAMGYDTSELENLEDELKQILDDIKKSKPKCKVRLKTKGEFQNVYVDGVLGEEEEESEDEEEEDDEDDDKKKSKKSKKSKKKDDEDEDEEEEEDEEESDDEDEDSDDEEESDDDEEESDDEEEDEDEEEEEPKKKGKKKSSKKDEDEEEEEEDEDEEDEDEEEVEDEVDVVVGSVVKADSKKLGKIKGEVVELFESEGKVLIKTDKGKTLKLKADQITSVEESPAESVPKKKKKKSKK
jgi:hypothetical protein